MTLLLLALALAMDSVALSLVNGANCKNSNVLEVLKMAFLGFKMIKESKEIHNNECIIKLNTKELVIGAIATSIDALAVGVTFSFEQINIFYTCAMIGVVCFTLCIVAFYIGKKLGLWLEQRALVFGGVILILIGCKILIEHLGIFSL